MSAQEMIAELPQLTTEEREQVAQALRELAEARAAQEVAEAKPKRKAGLHEGQWKVADDFDDPLPDNFWLGEDA